MPTRSLPKWIILIFAVVLYSATSLFAQKATATTKPKKDKLFGNSIQFVTGDYRTKNWAHTLGGEPVAQIGAYINRHIYKNIGIGIGYSEWNRNKFLVPLNHHMLQEYPPNGYIPIVGEIKNRWDYKMVDGYIRYQYPIFKSQHFIHAELGVSYCWGVNEYLQYYWENPEPGGDAMAFYGSENVFYWGIIPSIGYNYYFLKKRLNIGMFIRARYYQYRPMQLDVAFNLGVNF